MRGEENEHTKLMKKTLAFLDETSPFQALFPDGVPIKGILSRPADCIGDAVQDVYMVDLDKLTPEQFDKVSEMVWEQCGRSRSLEVARQEMKASGLPLRAKHVKTVETNVPFFLWAEIGLTSVLVSAKKLFMANENNLDDHTVDELHRIAHREGAEVPAGALKADIIKAIQKNRKHSGAAHEGAKHGAKAGAGPAPAGVEEQIRHGGVPADDPRRSPAPETVDIQERSKELQQEDRKRQDVQGSKEEPAATVWRV
jgi:hypothetical protein